MVNGNVLVSVAEIQEILVPKMPVMLGVRKSWTMKHPGFSSVRRLALVSRLLVVFVVGELCGPCIAARVEPADHSADEVEDTFHNKIQDLPRQIQKVFGNHPVPCIFGDNTAKLYGLDTALTLAESPSTVGSKSIRCKLSSLGVYKCEADIRVSWLRMQVNSDKHKKEEIFFKPINYQVSAAYIGKEFVWTKYDELIEKITFTKVTRQLLTTESQRTLLDCTRERLKEVFQKLSQN